MLRDAELATGGHIRIVAMTAHAMHGAREECLSRGMDGYLPKPIDTEALWRELDSLAQSAVEVSVPKSEKSMRVADFALARQTMDDSRELFDEIVAMFLLDAPVHMQKIKDALVQEDASAIRHSAHTLKGMAGIFSAERTLDAANRLEQLAGEPGCSVVVTQLEEALSELIAAINDYQW